MAVSYSPEDDSGVTKKTEMVTVVEVPEVHQIEGECYIFGSTVNSIQKWILVLGTIVIALFVFYYWLIFPAILNNNGKIDAESSTTGNIDQVNFFATTTNESEYPTTHYEMATSDPTLTESITIITSLAPRTSKLTPTTSTTRVTTTTNASHKQEGNVEITVIRAFLPKTDFWSDTDPFVKVSVGNRHLGQTSLIKNDRYPYWRERFYADRVKVDSWINFSVYDKDVTRNVLIGDASISIKQTVEDGNLGKVLKSQVCDSNECEIFAIVNFTWLQ